MEPSQAPSDEVEIRGSDGASGSKSDEKNSAGSLSSADAECQLRSDVQSLGFSSWDEGFDPCKIPVLADVVVSREEASLMFFHEEAMSILLGMRFSFSKISFGLRTQEVVVEVLPEHEWRAFWTSSYRGPFKPFLFGKSAPEETKAPNILTKEQALSTIGLWVEGGETMVFEDMEKFAHLFQPRWTSVVRSIIDVVQNDGGSRRKSDEINEPEPLGHVLGQGQSNAEEQVRQGEQRSPLSIVVVFRDLKYEISVAGENGLEKVEEGEDMGVNSISSIWPVLTLEFHPRRQRVHARFYGQFLIGSEDSGRPEEWFQDDLRLSFESMDREGEKYLDKSRIIGPVQYVEAGAVKQLAAAKSSKIEKLYREMPAGQFTFIPGNVQKNGKDSRPGSLNENDQSIPESSETSIEPQIPSFHVYNHEICLKMEYKASHFDKIREEGHSRDMLVKGPGVQSNVSLKVEAKYDLFGEDTHLYELKAIKTLSKKVDVNIPDPSGETGMGREETKAWRSWVEIQGRPRRWQIFSNKLFLNHNFAEFFQNLDGPDPHEWKLVSLRPDQG